MPEKYLGSDMPKLGFGMMRLPTLGSDLFHGDIDIEQVKTMVDWFLSKGFTYFDTAYVYGDGKSEMAIRDALVRRYPRESFHLADKLPLWGAKTSAHLRKLFNTSLERTGAGYFDFYLLHSLDAESFLLSEQIDAWQFMRDLKAEGQIKHAGFSFHDKAAVLDEILTAHPEAEFVQLQINYVDWDDQINQSRLCYETARRHGKPVIIMEPAKGGLLVDMNPEIISLFKNARPDRSTASWAIRYAASLEGLIVVLSGMSDLDQLIDNASVISEFKPLDAAERAVIAKVVAILGQSPSVPCTDCKYCVDGCPQSIDIPAIFRAVNEMRTFGDLVRSRGSYGFATQDGGKASDCIQCGACESHCPQHIEIIRELEQAAATFE